MSGDQEDRGNADIPLPVVMGSQGMPPAALFGFEDGVAWVADDVFVTRLTGGILLVERWDGRGVTSAVLRPDSEGFLRELWVALNAVAMTGEPE
jgi:hypothetical protein